MISFSDLPVYDSKRCKSFSFVLYLHRVCLWWKRLVAAGVLEGLSGLAVHLVLFQFLLLVYCIRSLCASVYLELSSCSQPKECTMISKTCSERHTVLTWAGSFDDTDSRKEYTAVPPSQNLFKFWSISLNISLYVVRVKIIIKNQRICSS